MTSRWCCLLFREREERERRAKAESERRNREAAQQQQQRDILNESKAAADAVDFHFNKSLQKAQEKVRTCLQCL